jgi:hypothetical protein
MVQLIIMGVLKPPFNTMKIIYYNKIKKQALEMPKAYRQLMLFELSKSLIKPTK